MLTLANKVTLIRILLIPVFMVFLLSKNVLAFFSISVRWGAIIAGVIFSLAALTDTLDGYIARSQGQVTTAGALLDPLADKLLVSAALISLVDLGRLSSWIALVIISREFAVMGLRMVATSKNVVLPSTQWGKLKTLFQILAIAAIIFKLPTPEIGPIIEAILIAMMIVLTVGSGIDYFAKTWGILIEGQGSGDKGQG